MSDLVDWLRQQIAEDRLRAGLATAGPWRPSDTAPYSSGDHWQDVCSPSGSVTVAHEEPCCLAADAAHIARWCPAGVDGWLTAVLAVIDTHPPTLGFDGDHLGAEICATCSTEDYAGGLDGDPYPCKTIRLLALPYAGRPGYLEEWRPSP